VAPLFPSILGAWAEADVNGMGAEEFFLKEFALS
jgi:hypothetical protein